MSDPSTTRSSDARHRAVWAVTTMLLVTAALLTWQAERLYDGDRFPVRVIVCALVLVAARRIEFHFEVREHGLSIDATQFVLVIALGTLSPFGLLVAYGASAPSLRRLLTRGERIKVAFNAATWMASASLAALTLVLLDHHTDAPRSMAVFLATLFASMFEGACVSMAIRITSGASWSRLVVPAVLGTAAATANASVGVLALHLVEHEPAMLVSLAIPVTLAYVGYLRHTRLTNEHAQLKRLYRYTGELVRAPELQEMLISTMREALDATNASRTRVVILDPAGAVTVALTMGSDDEVSPADIDPENPPTDLAHLFSELEPHLEPDGSWAVAPLTVAGSLHGALTVFDRVGRRTEFADHELALLTTIADHAAMSVENARLVAEIRREADEREHEALHDSLTGLGNRRLFYRVLHQALSASRNDGTTLSVMLVDLNGFKDVNDLLGHAAGDEALRTVADRLRDQCSNAMALARLGGDEFAVLTAGGPDDAYLLGESIRRAMEEPLHLDGIPITVGAAIGMAFYPQHGTEGAVLLKRADQALYGAKQRPEVPVQAFDGASDRSTARRVALATDLREAIEARQLEVYFQPQADLASGRLSGAEALLRWKHPRLGPIPPDELIAIGEHIGLIGRITSFVLETAIADAARWRAAGHDLVLSVNLSARNLLDPSLPSEVSTILTRHGLPPRLLTLEITETQLMSEPERAVPILVGLGELGVGLSIDDFGTGYSSLAYLKRLPVTELKIDKSFVLELPTDPDDQAIVRTVIQLGSNLGLDVVAEGIEDQPTWDLLVGMGCHKGQGYFLARPLPSPAFSQWLMDRAGRALGLTSN